MPTQPLRVLLVATRSRVAAELAWALTAQGHRVTAVRESAHAQVEIRARNYDCVLVEPAAFPDTANVIRALRAGNVIPIVLIVGRGCECGPTPHAGADACLTSPFTSNGLLSCVRHARRALAG